MTLAERILDYRAREDISQAEFAVRAGVDRTTIIKAEKGGNVTRLTAAKINLVLTGEATDGKT